MTALPIFCSHCGEKLPPLRAEAIACPSCGGALRETALASVGEAVTDSRSAGRPLSESVQRPRHWPPALIAGLLALLLPGAGQFYNGHVFRGFAVLLTFWLILPWILGVIDAVVSARRVPRTTTTKATTALVT